MRSNFIVDQKALLAILSSMQPICGRRTSIDATSYILFEVGYKEMVLKSTDLEVSLQASCHVQHNSLTQTHHFLVPGKRVFDVVKELDGAIEFTVVDTQVLLTANGVRLSLNVKDAYEFPPFPERIENLMDIDALFLLELLNKVAFLIPQNNANASLNGLYWEVTDSELRMTTTDGHCLAQVKTNQHISGEQRQWLIPRRAIFELKKIIESSMVKTVFIGLCGNQLVFSGESFNFFTKLLGESFPKYAAILDKTDFTAARIDRSRLVKTLRRSACLLSGQFIATTFTFSHDLLRVSMENKEVGNLEESVPLETPLQEKLAVRFYAPYLLSGLQVFTDDNVQFFLKNASKPVLFESHAENYVITYLVMPVAPVNHG